MLRANLAAGMAGRLLALVEGSAIVQFCQLDDAVSRNVSELAQQLGAVELLPSYLDGVFGAVWSLSAASTAWSGGEASDIDVSELACLAHAGLAHAKHWPLDLAGSVTGALFVLSYFGDVPEVAVFVERAVGELEDAMQFDGWSGKAYWADRRRPSSVNSRETAVDLGIAHGIPGIIGALLRVSPRGAPLHDRITKMVRPVLRFLLSMRSHGAEKSEFPSSMIIGKKSEFPSRLAWCYGDPGVASVLLDAGMFLNDPQILEEALEVGVLAAKRVLSRSELLGHCLCHGMAGLLVIFRKLARHFPDPELGAAADMLREELINWGLRDLEKGRQPYACQYFLDEHGANLWPENDGFLFGMSGVLLALLAERVPGPRWWMRALLLDEVDEKYALPRLQTGHCMTQRTSG